MRILISLPGLVHILKLYSIPVTEKRDQEGLY